MGIVMVLLESLSKVTQKYVREGNPRIYANLVASTVYRLLAQIQQATGCPSLHIGCTGQAQKAVASSRHN